MTQKVRIGIIGLGFGAEFIPIYQAHPHAELVAVCQRTEDSLRRIADHFGIAGRHTSIESMLADPEIDAVHINSPIAAHAEQSIAALNAGKHVACTVPMATSVEDCARIVKAQQDSGKSYMMMETAVYTREFLYAKDLRDSGQLGRIQFLRGAHMQEMAGWPDYWLDLPPMHYATHAIAPLLALGDREAESVRCLGSGRVNHAAARGGPPFAVETALFRLRDSDLAMEVTRSLFDIAREYVESFDVYGEKESYEWQQIERESPVVFTGEDGRRVDIPDYADRLPASIREYTTRGVYDATENQHLSFTQGSGHGGSHPHLAHEFVTAIVEGRAPFPDVYAAANWTSAGICAHESALRGGEEIDLPVFARPAADALSGVGVHA
ncbi:Gfo/Idh/MocA family oxidoreductase [Micromonospora sp. NBC_01699]|uniref:Gfo/Idh/MocA family protein n=1 Tax=Micromonospora sp. NBC_01699 TaxID=2975984 RepID=UPI002E292749|nr:Gfo/Idh/MocA family oxidoreductase [Micromonospora sp. NBC_01699]